MIEAKTELNKYKEHRDKKEWKLSEKFSFLYEKLKDIEVKENNLSFYKENIKLSEEYIYKDIPWVNLLLYDNFKDKRNKEKLLFNDLKGIDVIINKHKFMLLKKSKINDIYQFKLLYDKENQRYIPLQVQKSSQKKDDFITQASSDIALVDHINNDKKLFHYIVNSSSDGIIKFSQTDIRPKIGDFIKIYYFKTYDKKKDKNRIRTLDIKFTKEINSSLVKTTTGELSLKYKYNNQTISYNHSFLHNFL